MSAPPRSQLQWFGLVVASFFGVIGAVLWQLGSVGPARSAWSAGAVVAVLYYLIPPLRIPLYLTWMTVFAPVGWFVSQLALAIVFYALMTPIAIVMRLFRRDALRLRRDPSAATYWHRREPAVEVARYFRQA